MSSFYPLLPSHVVLTEEGHSLKTDEKTSSRTVYARPDRMGAKVVLELWEHDLLVFRQKRNTTDGQPIDEWELLHSIPKEQVKQANYDSSEQRPFVRAPQAVQVRK